MATNPLPAGTEAAWRWDEAQVTIDSIRQRFPAPTNPGDPDPLDDHPGMQRKLNEARAVQIVVHQQYVEEQDVAQVDADIESTLRDWRRANPRPQPPEEEGAA